MGDAEQMSDPIALGRPRRSTLYWAGDDVPGAGDVLVSYSPARRVEQQRLILQLHELAPRTISGHIYRRMRCETVTIVLDTAPDDARLVVVERGTPR